jgi:hypothetical protein
VDVDDPNVERVPVESRAFQDLYNRPDRVVLTEVVVEPQLVDPLVAA